MLQYFWISMHTEELHPSQSLFLTSQRNRKIHQDSMSLCHLLWFRPLQSHTPLGSSVFKILQIFIRSVQSVWQGTERSSLLSDFSALGNVLATRRLIEPKQLKLSLDMSNLHGKAATTVVLEPSFAQHLNGFDWVWRRAWLEWAKPQRWQRGGIWYLAISRVQGLVALLF